MKKTVAMIMTAAALASAAAPLNASAANSANITFSLETLDHVTSTQFTVYGELTVTDVDHDGRLTQEDAMYLAHEKYYPGGAAAGYDSVYIWGVSSLYTCNIMDPDDNCVYTSSGPYHSRETLQDGDHISWTAQYLGGADIYFVSLKDAPSQTEFPVGTEVTLHVACAPHLKKDAGRITAEGLRVSVNGTFTGITTDSNGDAKIKLSSAGAQNIQITKADTEEVVGTYEVSAYETVSYRAANDETPETIQTTTTTAAETTTTAAETTTTAAASTTTAAQTTSTAAATSAATTTTAAATTAAATARTGNVKTGDATPLAALFLAGLGAAGAAVTCTAKRREN